MHGQDALVCTNRYTLVLAFVVRFNRDPLFHFLVSLLFNVDVILQNICWFLIIVVFDAAGTGGSHASGGSKTIIIR